MEMLELATDLKGARAEIKRLRADYALLADDYMQLLGDVERLRAELAKADGQINRCVEQNKYLESTISRLREYARHKPCCPNGIFLAASCDCGYDALLAAKEE